MRFEFATAGRVVVGPDVSAEIPSLVDARNSRVLLVHGRAAMRRGGPAAERLRQLDSEMAVVEWIAVEGEPTIHSVEEAANRARMSGCNLIIGLGGGSVLDTAKAIAGLAANPGHALTYMEVVGEGRPLSNPVLPVMAVPTTAGTGSEVTRNAVIAAPEQKVKVSIRSPSLMPRWAVVDSLLTHDMPPEITASSGVDALTQLLEAFVSRRASPVTDGLCIEGLNLAARSLLRAYHHPGDAAARQEMSTASLMSGMALANAGLGIIHGIAGVVGGTFGVGHGAAVAAVLPAAAAVNIESLELESREHPALARYNTAAQILSACSEGALCGRGSLARLLEELTLEMKIPRLSRYGIGPGDVPALAAQAAKANSTRGNPLDLPIRRIEEIIERAI